MNTHEQTSQQCVDYINDNFEKEDLLACVLVNKRTGAVLQRLAATRTVATGDFQRWLRARNDQGFDVYISMNALRPNASRRTKEDVLTIRHLYLDFDADGTASLERMKQESNLPPPSYELSTSPGKWQAVWRVYGFTKELAETLQRALAQEWRADPAATDCARVMRLPGFFNHKYAEPYLVGVKKLSDRLFTPDQFPATEPSRDLGDERVLEPWPSVKPQLPLAVSQSERDWSFAKRSLARGQEPEKIVDAIAAFRSGEKADPRYYADRTVRRAQKALEKSKHTDGNLRRMSSDRVDFTSNLRNASRRSS